jgi:hypothetical protein
MIYEIKILFLKVYKYGYLSDISTQFRVDKSDIVRYIYKLPAMRSQSQESNNIKKQLRRKINKWT